MWSVTHEDGEAQIENAQATFKNYILTSDVILLYRRIIAIIIAIIIQENYCYNNIASCGISNVHLPLTDGIHSCRLFSCQVHLPLLKCYGVLGISQWPVVSETTWSLSWVSHLVQKRTHPWHSSGASSSTLNLTAPP